MEPRLVKCWSCQMERIFDNRNPNVVCSLDDNGDVLIKKMHGGFIKIIGSSYALNCMNCGVLVYKKPNDIDMKPLLNVRSIFMMVNKIYGTA